MLPNMLTTLLDIFSAQMDGHAEKADGAAYACVWGAAYACVRRGQLRLRKMGLRDQTMRLPRSRRRGPLSRTNTAPWRHIVNTHRWPEYVLS